jgi:4-hydroxy-3-polyprenylbenzoate decarboxylase
MQIDVHSLYYLIQSARIRPIRYFRFRSEFCFGLLIILGELSEKRPLAEFSTMGYASLRQCLMDLQANGRLLAIDEPVDAHLEAAAICRRVYAAGGPAIWFRNVKNCRFTMVGNLYGTLDRAEFIFRDSLAFVRKLVALKVDPQVAARAPWKFWDLPVKGLSLLPKKVRSGPVNYGIVPKADLPQLVCWPRDGGAFVTLPVVYTEHPAKPGWRHSNLGMYRVQISGNDYAADEVGLHYQIHRGIGVHHSAAIDRGQKLPVNIAVGGPPAFPFAAVMPLPEDLPELVFAGALGGRRVRLAQAANGLAMPAEADFVLSGWIDPNQTKPEGPFGDHLGYYAQTHEFPFLKLAAVHHRRDAIWPFTTVGRPPQEDTTFGELIHEITGPVIPTVLPGVRAVHAVDAAGVHPLLLAIGSERYVPYAAERRPQELLTQASAILGQGQMSLAKYLFIIAGEDAPGLDIHRIGEFLLHMLERFDPAEDLHFHTRTTIDTLDYSGHGLNAGSKLVIAAAGPKRRSLPTEISADLRLPEGWVDAKLVMPGVLAVSGVKSTAQRGLADVALGRFCAAIDGSHPLRAFPLVVLCDDAEFMARSLNNFLWVTFTRSNPAADVDGADSATVQKHWLCQLPMVIDARTKPYHSWPLEDDPAIEKKVDEWAASGKPLHGVY